MRTKIIVLATLVLSTEVLAQSPVRPYAFPHDPYRWCAVYSGDAGGASNCGFLHHRAMPGNRERHRRLLRAQSITRIQGNPRAPSARKLAQPAAAGRW